MRGEEFFSVGKKSKIAVWCFVLTFFILPFVMAAADFSLFTLHSSLAEDSIKVQPNLMVEEEEIPDSLLHPRWKIQKTTPVVTKDLDSTALDLRMPDNIKQEAEYDDSAGVYLIGSKIGSSYLNTPILMMPDEYQEWSRKQSNNLPKYYCSDSFHIVFLGHCAEYLQMVLKISPTVEGCCFSMSLCLNLMGLDSTKDCETQNSTGQSGLNRSIFCKVVFLCKCSLYFQLFQCMCSKSFVAWKENPFVSVL